MATKILRLKLIKNLATNDIITYKIWKSNGTMITYGNGIQIPTLRAWNSNGAINNFQIGNNITETMQSLYNAFINYNYNYAGLTYEFNGVDEIIIRLTTADGFEHRINTIQVPQNKMLVLADDKCGNAYIYNETLLNQYIGPLTLLKDSSVYFNDNHPTKFDAEVPRGFNYNTVIGTYTLNIPISTQLNNYSISHTLLPSLVGIINIVSFPYFSYGNYYFRFAGNTNSDRVIEGLLPNTINYIKIIDKWGCEIVYQIKTGPVDLGFIIQPQKWTPVYNPVLFKFSLPNYSETGFDYYLELKNELTNKTIAKFIVKPDVDGSGYVDISKHLSNLTTYDFGLTISNDNCKNSFVKYSLGLGYQLNQTWNYSDYHLFTFDGKNYTELVDDVGLITPNFSVGDLVNITTSIGVTQPINGLHKVVAVFENSIVVDVIYPGGTGYPVGGNIKFADNRKTLYPNLYVSTNNFVWNGAMDWKTWKSYLKEFLVIKEDSGTNDVNLLTSLKSLTNDYIVTTTQDFWLNLAVADPQVKYYAKFDNDFGQTFSVAIGTSSTDGYVKQFKIKINDLINYGFTPNTNWVKFYIVDESNIRVTNEYKLNVDKRCKIENYEILFLDRFGSFQSFAFPLRAYTKGNIKREDFNKQIDWFSNYNPTGPRQSSNQTIDLTDAGRTLWNVEVVKELTLNTNWMTDEMSVLFEELLTSPATFIKLGEFEYYPCIVKETSFDVTRQKNKKLIKKEVTVTYSNDNPINI